MQTTKCFPFICGMAQTFPYFSAWFLLSFYGFFLVSRFFFVFGFGFVASKGQQGFFIFSVFDCQPSKHVAT